MQRPSGAGWCGLQGRDRRLGWQSRGSDHYGEGTGWRPVAVRLLPDRTHRSRQGAAELRELAGARRGLGSGEGAVLETVTWRVRQLECEWLAECYSPCHC